MMPASGAPMSRFGTVTASRFTPQSIVSRRSVFSRRVKRNVKNARLFPHAARICKYKTGLCFDQPKREVPDRVSDSDPRIRNPKFPHHFLRTRMHRKDYRHVIEFLNLKKTLNNTAMVRSHIHVLCLVDSHKEILAFTNSLIFRNISGRSFR